MKRRVIFTDTLGAIIARLYKRYLAFISSKRFGRLFKLISVGILLGSTIFWSWLGADIHKANADQLIDGYLFENGTTFGQAHFPGAHTFLFKWPLFALLRFFDFSLTSFAVLTVIMCVATVAVLIWILHRIERRPLVFGLLCLALTSVLLAIPAQPHDNALLPVNMAMITTRNLEYALFLLALYAVMRRRILSWSVAAAFAGLTLLFASDKLFVVLTLGSGALGYVLFRIANRVKLTVASLRWFFVGLAAAIAANGLLWAISASGLTNIVDEASASPFTFTHELRNIALGIIFGIGSLLTNFGANPAYDVAVLRQLPQIALDRLMHPTGLVYLANITAFITALYTTVRVTIASAKSRPDRQTPEHGMAVLLLLAAITAGGAYLFTDHYHPVDARYLFIGFFALVISAAVYVRSIRKLSKPLLGGVLLAFLLIIPLAVCQAQASHQRADDLFAERDRQNRLIAQIITDSRTRILVGDYWTTVPIRSYLPADYQLTIMPLQGCKNPYPVLNSTAWQTDLSRSSFMYLAHQDKPEPKGIYDSCTLDEIMATYGVPNANYIVAGTTTEPSEMLLLYERGIRKDPREAARDALLPISSQRLANRVCRSTTVMNIVAHEDDDLLFMNPDTQRAIDGGKCVRTIFVTSGDAGFGAAYWSGRELGAKAAYAAMAGKKDVWVQRTVQFGDHYAVVASLEDDPKISLVFLRLPDGNLRGQGFHPQHRVSLDRLERGYIDSVSALDRESVYSRAGLTNLLVALMRLYAPAEIRTQSAEHDAFVFDHSDHSAVGRFVRLAFEQYQPAARPILREYIGYPIRRLPPNLSAADMLAKERAFMTYAAFDSAVCHSVEECRGTAYEPFLQRQYTTNDLSSLNP